ncbi:MAG: carboxypeptidase regulatory-like domain-containing protein [Williamsia sp.]|nr:carboxypeptidase regulatory-like domain-containing protein [Williamsia sp.]
MRKFILIAATAMLVSYKGVHSSPPFLLEGVVQDKVSGQPLKAVHVFTVKGEEEAVTNEKGVFRFQSWKETVVLTAESPGYQKKQVQLTLPAPKQTVLLEKE